MPSSLSRRLGNLLSLTKNEFGIAGKTSEGYFRVRIISGSILQITISSSEEVDDFSYAVIAKPAPVAFELIDDSALHIYTRNIELTIHKNPVSFIFKNRRGQVLNEDDPGLGVSWIGEQVTSYKKLQEGERFIDLLRSEKQLEHATAWKIHKAPFDLFTKYLSAMERISAEVREKLADKFAALSWKILESLCFWVAGEFRFEEGEFPPQEDLLINTGEVIAHGARFSSDYGMIQKTLFHGNALICAVPDCMELHRSVKLSASERTILLRSEGGIAFSELNELSDLPDEILGKTLFLLSCLRMVEIKRLERTKLFS